MPELESSIICLDSGLAFFHAALKVLRSSRTWVESCKHSNHGHAHAALPLLGPQTAPNP